MTEPRAQLALRLVVMLACAATPACFCGTEDARSEGYQAGYYDGKRKGREEGKEEAIACVRGHYGESAEDAAIWCN